MYNEPMRIMFVQWPVGPLVAVAHYEYCTNFDNWLDVEVEENEAKYQPHYDYYDMWADHHAFLAECYYLDSFPTYRTDQEIAEGIGSHYPLLDPQFDETIPF